MIWNLPLELFNGIINKLNQGYDDELYSISDYEFWLRKNKLTKLLFEHNHKSYYNQTKNFIARHSKIIKKGLEMFINKPYDYSSGSNSFNKNFLETVSRPTTYELIRETCDKIINIIDVLNPVFYNSLLSQERLIIYDLINEFLNIYSYYPAFKQFVDVIYDRGDYETNKDFRKKYHLNIEYSMIKNQCSIKSSEYDINEIYSDDRFYFDHYIEIIASKDLYQIKYDKIIKILTSGILYKIVFFELLLNNQSKCRMTFRNEYQYHNGSHKYKWKDIENIFNLDGISLGQISIIYKNVNILDNNVIIDGVQPFRKDNYIHPFKWDNDYICKYPLEFIKQFHYLNYVNKELEIDMIELEDKLEQIDFVNQVYQNVVTKEFEKYSENDQILLLYYIATHFPKLLDHIEKDFYRSRIWYYNCEKFIEFFLSYQRTNPSETEERAKQRAENRKKAQDHFIMIKVKALEMIEDERNKCLLPLLNSFQDDENDYLDDYNVW